MASPMFRGRISPDASCRGEQQLVKAAAFMPCFWLATVCYRMLVQLDLPWSETSLFILCDIIMSRKLLLSRDLRILKCEMTVWLKQQQ